MTTKVISVDFDHQSIFRQLQRFSRKQVPFATSVALNETVQDVEVTLVKELPRWFTIRSQWTAKGIRTKRATKNLLEAEVGTRDPYMARQAIGGTKTPTKSKAIGVPVRARRTPQSRIGPGRFPGVLGKKKGTFIRRTKSGTAAMFMPTRTRTRKKRKLRLMYYLVKRVEVPQRWPFEDTFTRVVKQEWRRNMAFAFKRALRTARR